MSTRKGLGGAGVVLVTLLACALPALGQLPTYGLGRAPSPEEIKAWDVTVGPDGKELPPGGGTAALGKPVYLDKCARCHGRTGQDPKYEILVGGRGTLNADEPLKTIGSFWPYATTLWSYINRSQPLDSPGSLTADEVYAVTAYLLYLNGIIGENDVIDPKTLPHIKMPNRDGFGRDPRPDVGKGARPPKR